MRDLFPADGLPIDEGRLLPQLRRVIDGEYGGLRIRVDNVSGSSERIMVRSKIYDADGNEVGHVRRELQKSGDRLTVHHDSFSLNKNVQGHGCSTEFNDAMIDWYKDSDVKEVTLVANKDVGSYAWARQDFDFATQHEAVEKFGNRLDRELGNEESKLQQLRSEYDSMPDGPEKWRRRDGIKDQTNYIEQIEDLRKRFKIGSSNFPTARDIADLGRPEGLLPGESRGLSWLGKRVFLEPHAIDWRGVKSLEKVVSR